MVDECKIEQGWGGLSIWCVGLRSSVPYTSLRLYPTLFPCAESQKCQHKGHPRQAAASDMRLVPIQRCLLYTHTYELVSYWARCDVDVVCATSQHRSQILCWRLPLKGNKPCMTSAAMVLSLAPPREKPKCVDQLSITMIICPATVL